MGKTETPTLLNPTEVPSRAAQVKVFLLVAKHASSSLSRHPNVIWGTNRLCAVGDEWIVQCPCAINKGGTAVNPSFYKDGFFVDIAPNAAVSIEIYTSMTQFKRGGRFIMMDKEEGLKKLDAIKVEALQALAEVTDEDTLEAWRVAHLGRSSPVMAVFSNMAQLDKALRPLMGKAANEVRQALEAALEEKSEVLSAEALKKALETERLDVTLPGRPVERGRLHPLTQVLRRIIRIFGDMGYQVYYSPEVETDDYNFTYLNMPPYHPARDMWDTFYTKTEGVLLRTHTSPGQIRVMREHAPDPIRAILPGTTMRYEQLSARSEIEFAQVEVLVVGKHVTFAELKGTLDDFVRRLFGEDARMRLRPNYFPFTEPSAELDVGCFVCDGKGCPVCKESGWLEILGCGMVHPRVLEYGGYDPTIYSGFAAGMGIDRSTLMRYRIDDIRHFRNNDIRFLRQF